MMVSNWIKVLKFLGKNQDNHDQQDQAQTTARVISPSSAVRPSWQSAQKQQYKDYEQDGSQLGLLERVKIDLQNLCVNPTAFGVRGNTEVYVAWWQSSGIAKTLTCPLF